MFKKCLFIAAFAACCVSVHAAGFSENFSNDPASDGWRIYGDTNLATWDSTNHSLQFTWDSGQTNTYFYHPLGTVVSRDDDFSITFDLLLKDIGPGPDTNKVFSFNIGIGFLNLAEATQTGFLRGTGFSSPDLCEFDYYFDSGYGATVWPLIVDANSTFNYNGSSDYTISAFDLNQWYHIAMSYTASNQTMVTTVTSAATNFTIIDPVAASLGDFRVDTFSISSYNDDQGYGSSILAHGNVANIAVTVPPPPIAQFTAMVTNGVWSAQFPSRTNWTYTLQRSANLKTWADAVSTAGTGNEIQLQDTPDGTMWFYRVQAHR